MSKELENNVRHEVRDKDNPNQINAYCAKDCFKDEVKKNNHDLTFQLSISKRYVEASYMVGNVKYCSLFTKREISANFGKVEVAE